MIDLARGTVIPDSWQKHENDGAGEAKERDYIADNVVVGECAKSSASLMMQPRITTPQATRTIAA